MKATLFSTMLVALLAGSLFANTWTGQDAPGRVAGTTSPTGQYVRIVANPSAIPAYTVSSSLPSGPRLSSSFTLSNGISLLELWLQTSSGYYLSQYMTVTQDGTPAGQMDVWSTDTENRYRTRADYPWYAIAHISTVASIVTENASGDKVRTYLTSCPFSITWGSGPLASSPASFSGSSFTSGTYSANSFNRTVSLGSDVAHYALTHSSSSTSATFSTSYSLYATIDGTDGTSTFLASSPFSVTVTPKTTGSSSISPTSLTINPSDPLIASSPVTVSYQYSATNYYPHSKVVVELDRPSSAGADTLLVENDHGNSSSTASGTDASVSAITIPINQFSATGTYRVKVYQKSPILSGGTAPSATLSNASSVSGGWETLADGSTAAIDVTVSSPSSTIRTNLTTL